jgi:hypothetical protein
MLKKRVLHRMALPLESLLAKISVSSPPFSSPCQAGLYSWFPSCIGWHAFRHIFRSLLDETGAPLKVQQELMRHADVRTTMNIYGKTMEKGKREARGKIVRLVFGSQMA